MNSISAEKNSTVIFPLPMDIINNYLAKKSSAINKQDKSRGFKEDVKKICLKAEKSKAE